MTSHDREHDPLQERVDDELRRTYAVPEGLGRRVAARVREESSRPATPTAWPDGLPLAAALLGVLLAGLGWMAWMADGASSDVPAPLHADPLFAQLLGASEGINTCGADSVLGDACNDRYGERLVLEPSLPVVGPLACESWPTALALAVQTLPTPVMLLIDRLDRDPGLGAGVAGGVWVERQELGQLVLYQLSRQGNDAMGCLPSLQVKLAE